MCPIATSASVTANSHPTSQVIVATSGKTECIFVCRPRLTARGHLYGGDDLDALQHCRDQRGRDPIIAKAALASDGKKARGNQLAQVSARRRARDIGAVSKLSGRQRLAAHKGIKHRRSRSVTHESGHLHQICRRDHRQTLSLIPEAYQSKTVWHGPNCSRGTIVNPAARMRCGPSRATVGMEDGMVAYWVARSKVNDPEQYKNYADLGDADHREIRRQVPSAGRQVQGPSRARRNFTASSSSRFRASRRQSLATNCPSTSRPPRTARRTARAN